MSRHDPHENITQKNEVKGGTDKSFGLVFSFVFALIGFWPALFDEPLRTWALGVTVILLIVSLSRPQILAPFNRVWLLFGLVLHKIVNPVVMGLIYYSAVTPIGLIMRLLGKRPLNLEFDPAAKSYWIERKPPGPEPETITRQF
jgi:predicted membrane metal-binding protein